MSAMALGEINRRLHAVREGFASAAPVVGRIAKLLDRGGTTLVPGWVAELPHEARAMYEFDRRIPVEQRPRQLTGLGCYRRLADGRQCLHPIFEWPDGTRFCYRHGRMTRRGS